MARTAGFSSNRHLQVSHWNGYARSNAVQVRLPPKLKCSLCNKHKNTEANFSNKELIGLQEVIARNGQGAAQTHEMICILCNSSCISVEMTCIDCQKTMGLDAFAKTQRRDRDNAKCKRCSAKRVGLKPIQNLKGEQSAQAENWNTEQDDTTSEYGSSMDDSTSVTGSMSTLTVSSKSSQTDSSIDTMNTPGGYVGGVRILVEDDWLDDNEHRKRARPVGSSASSTRGSSIDGAYSSGITSRVARASSSGNSGSSHATYPDKPATLAPPRLAPSDADSNASSGSTNTENGSRAKFVFPKVERASAAETADDSDSDSDDAWGEEEPHSAIDEDSDDESDEGPDFFG